MHPFSENEAKEKLNLLSQSALLRFWDELKVRERENLLKSIEQIDPHLFQKQRESLHQAEPLPRFYTPYTKCKEGIPEYREKGKELLKAGKCAVVVLAGGSGSRLRFDGPKGCFPLTLVQKKSLYQRLAEKVWAASKQNQVPLEIAFMTSLDNSLATETFFAKHAFFHLSASQVHFFNQSLWPLLSFSGDLFLEAKDKIALGPNGNGVVFNRLIQSGLLEKWKNQGVEFINIIPVDNALADPFDPELLGFHAQQENEFSMRVALRKDRHEKVGVVVDVGDRPAVVEYSELSEEAKQEEAHFFANLNLYCFNLSFIERMKEVDLPLHKVKKAAKTLGQEGTTLLPHEVNSWKFEYFLFDHLVLAKKVGLLLSSREEHFAPLKNFEGEDSILTVQAALQMNDRKVYYNLSQMMPPKERVFELAPEFYYPTESMVEHWRGNSLPPTSYIECI